MPLDTANPNPETNRPETALYGWVYLGFLKEGLLKIGSTKSSPEKRRLKLEHGMGKVFDGWREFWVYAPGAAERWLHRELDWLREERGEWFWADRDLFEHLAARMTRSQATR